MGVSTDGRICYGALFEEGTEFPWDEDGQDIEDWWRDQYDWEPSKEVYDRAGNYLPGITRADIDAYYKERRDWLKEHPLPVELVNVCSGDCPIYILAVPGTVKTANRGYPVEIDKDVDFALDPKADIALVEFLQTHELEPEGPAKWYLSSEWN